MKGGGGWKDGGNLECAKGYRLNVNVKLVN